MYAIDYQRQRVYDAERPFVKHHGEGSYRIESVPSIQQWIDSIVRSQWWRDYRFVDYVNDTRQPKHGSFAVRDLPRCGVWVHDGRGRRSASGRLGRITLPKWSRCRGIILHELSHHAIPEGPGTPWHGRAFCRVYVDLVRQFISPGAGTYLETLFTAKRLNVGEAITDGDLRCAARPRT